VPNWVSIVTAMEARAVPLGRKLTYMYPDNAGLSASDLAKASAAGLPLDRMGADIHVGTGGAVEAAEAGFAKAPAYPIIAGNFEINAGE
jgi:hypothetical protein